jgi:ketosteroid isomerase-like protein
MSAAERVREVIGAINRGDIDEFLALIQTDFVWEVLDSSPLAGTYRGQEEVRAYMQEWLNTFDNVRLGIEELVELENQVLVVIRGSAQGKASGVEVRNHFCQLWTTSSDIPARMREYATRDEALSAAEHR